MRDGVPGFFVRSQYLLPKRAITVFGGKVASARAGALTTAIIRWFVGHYGVDMSEAADPDIRHYRSFDEFFTRALKPGTRIVAHNYGFGDWMPEKTETFTDNAKTRRTIYLWTADGIVRP